MDDSPSTAMLQAVREFAAELSDLKHNSEARGLVLREEVEKSLVALRHDVYGSVLLLSQGLEELRKVVQAEQLSAAEWRAVERQSRESGQRLYRAFAVISLVAWVVLAGAVLWLVFGGGRQMLAGVL